MSIGYKLKQKLEELNKLYSDDSITNTSLNMKASILSNKLQNEDIIDAKPAKLYGVCERLFINI